MPESTTILPLRSLSKMLPGVKSAMVTARPSRSNADTAECLPSLRSGGSGMARERSQASEAAPFFALCCRRADSQFSEIFLPYFESAAARWATIRI
jgi:hypothetical protein